MNNPLCPLLIVGMSFCFLICLSLVLILRRVVLHFLEKDAGENYFGK